MADELDDNEGKERYEIESAIVSAADQLEGRQRRANWGPDQERAAAEFRELVSKVGGPLDDRRPRGGFPFTDDGRIAIRKVHPERSRAGDLVTLEGRNLQEIGSVTVGGKATEFVTVARTRIQFRFPAGATKHEIVVGPAPQAPPRKPLTVRSAEEDIDIDIDIVHSETEED